MATEDPPLLCHVDAGAAAPTTTLRSGICPVQRTTRSRQVQRVQHLQDRPEAT